MISECRNPAVAEKIAERSTVEPDKEVTGIAGIETGLAISPHAYIHRTERLSVTPRLTVAERIVEGAENTRTSVGDRTPMRATETSTLARTSPHAVLSTAVRDAVFLCYVESQQYQTYRQSFLSTGSAISFPPE